MKILIVDDNKDICMLIESILLSEGYNVASCSTPADFKTQIAQLDKEKPVIIYCAAGSRSGKALSQMSQMGFKQVYDYAGGMNDWKAKGKKTIPQ